MPYGLENKMTSPSDMQLELPKTTIPEGTKNIPPIPNLKNFAIFCGSNASLRLSPFTPGQVST
ncbi:hypothetical protein ACHAXS_002961 [Conticribra weissflogii]